MDNLSAAYIDHTIYVAGGNENGKPGHSFYSMKLNKNLDGNWEKLPDFPGQTRLQPVLAAQQSADGVRIYLSSGFQPVSKDAYGVPSPEVAQWLTATVQSCLWAVSTTAVS